MATIAFINQKGGCGKSSTCFHLAGALANQGLRVLLVDVDPQGSLGQGYFGSQWVENLSLAETVAAAFTESSNYPDPSRLLRPTRWPGITLLPANQLLAPFNIPSPEQLGLEQFALHEFLQPCGTAFDITLIDCPPNLYRCSWSALLTADYVLIPVPPEDFGAQGLRVVQQAIEQAQRLNSNLQLLGQLVTRFDRRLIVHRTYERRLRQIYGDTVLATTIPEASAFKVALTCRQPVTFHDPRSVAARLTCELSREILDRITVRTREAATAAW